MAEARAALRSLLRTVNTQVTSVTGNRLWHDEVTDACAALVSLRWARYARLLCVCSVGGAQGQLDHPLAAACKCGTVILAPPWTAKCRQTWKHAYPDDVSGACRSWLSSGGTALRPTQRVAPPTCSLPRTTPSCCGAFESTRRVSQQPGKSPGSPGTASGCSGSIRLEWSQYTPRFSAGALQC